MAWLSVPSQARRVSRVEGGEGGGGGDGVGGAGGGEVGGGGGDHEEALGIGGDLGFGEGVDLLEEGGDVGAVGREVGAGVEGDVEDDSVFAELGVGGVVVGAVCFPEAADEVFFVEGEVEGGGGEGGGGGGGVRAYGQDARATDGPDDGLHEVGEIGSAGGGGGDLGEAGAEGGDGGGEGGGGGGGGGAEEEGLVVGLVHGRVDRR